MSGKQTTLAIKIVTDASGAKAGLAEVEAEADGFGEKLKKANIALAATVGGVAEMAKSAYEAAGQLEHAEASTEAVFGSQAEEVEKYAAKADQAAGLSEQAYEQMADTVGSKLANMGVAHDQLAAKTNELIQMGANLSARYGGSTTDAVNALSKAMAGQTKGLQQYGIVLKASDINTVLAANGQKNLTGEALRNATAVASLQLIQQQAGATTGAFAKQAGTAEGQQARLRAEYQNTEAKLGTLLLPAMAQLMKILADVTGFAEQHTQAVVILGAVFGGLALAVLGAEAAVRVWEAAEKVATGAQWLWNAAMDANPIGIIVIAIAALAAGVIIAYNKCKPFRDAINDVGNVAKTVFSDIGSFLDKYLIQPIEWVLDKIGKVGSVIKDIGHLFGSSGPAAGGSAGVQRFGAMAGGGAAPLRFGAAYSPLSGVGNVPAGAGQGFGDTYNITVNGALDPVGVADQIQTMLDNRAKRTGMAIAGARR